MWHCDKSVVPMISHAHDPWASSGTEVVCVFVTQ